jgi:peptide/nickel transport system permease protein
VIQAIYLRDYPLLQGAVMLLASVFVVANLIVDVLYAWLNPRLRDG